MTSTLDPIGRGRVDELVTRLRGVRLTVVGDVMLDRYLIGEAERISPEAPVPVVMVEEERDVPGGAANAAANAAAAGASVRLVGIVGDDLAGRELADALQVLGVDTSGLIVVPGRPTTTKTRIVARGQQVVRIDREVSNPLADRHRDAVLAAAHGGLADADALLIEDYDKGMLDIGMAADLVGAGRGKLPVVVDPKHRNFHAYQGATVLTPNRRELEAAFKTHFMGDDSDLESARARLGVDHLLLTLGADGIALVSAARPLLRASSVAREVFDVSGAGDTVAAWVASLLGAKATVAEAAWLANLAAGVKVGKRGTATVSPTELLHAWDEENSER